MPDSALNLLLADDDLDDCIFFKEALEELPVIAKLNTVNDGDQLMQHLSKTENHLPHALYLDLNMPRKNGFICLSEIKSNEKLKQLPVFIYSTSLDSEVVTLLQKQGASYYIRKPSEFSDIKKVILKSLNLISDKSASEKETFVISP